MGTTIKSQAKEQRARSLQMEPKMQVKYNKIIDAKLNLFDRISGDSSERRNYHLADIKIRTHLYGQNKKFIIHNPLIVRGKTSEDDEAEEQHQSITKKKGNHTTPYVGKSTIMVSNSKSYKATGMWPIQANIYLNDVDGAALPPQKKVIHRAESTSPLYPGTKNKFYMIQRVLNTGKHVCQRKKKKRLV